MTIISFDCNAANVQDTAIFRDEADAVDLLNERYSHFGGVVVTDA